MTKLAPCPFGGTDGERLIELWDRFDAGHIAHIHCMKCGAFGPSFYSEAGAQDAIRQAIEGWQRRQLYNQPA